MFLCIVPLPSCGARCAVHPKTRLLTQVPRSEVHFVFFHEVNEWGIDSAAEVYRVGSWGQGHSCFQPLSLEVKELSLPCWVQSPEKQRTESLRTQRF